MPIESPKNPRVSDTLVRLRRGELLAVEGARAIGEALEAGLRVSTVFAAPDEAEDEVLPRAREAGAEIVQVGRRVLERLSSVPSPRGLVAVAEIPRTDPDRVGPGSADVAVVLDGVQDPANVGAILRSAEAFGASALLTDGCASPFSARALRASAGSALRVPLATGLTSGEVVAWAARHGATLAGADAHGGEEPAALAEVRPLGLVIGSEGSGISAELSAALSRRVRISLGGRVESLNAAVAAGILLYALTPGSPPSPSSPRRRPRP